MPRRKKMNNQAKISFSLIVAFFLCTFGYLAAEIDRLPSWNEGPAKKAILEFVQSVSDPKNPKYVPPENRIATFDQDGTTWVEHPLYTQGLFALERVKMLSGKHPEWKKEEPFKSIIKGETQNIATFTEQDWVHIVAVTHTGMTTEAFLEDVTKWLRQAKHPRFKRPFTELIFQPMLEVMNYLRDHSFKVYIVTGGGQEFVRAYSQRVYGIPSEQIIGSTVATKYEYEKGKPVLMRQPKAFFIDNFAGKAIGINLSIGKKPIAAFGNSDGDREMLEWTQSSDGLSLMMLVQHDDPIREYAYGPAGGLPNTEIGTFTDSLATEAQQKGWIVISMKNDWKRIFPFDKGR